MSEQRDIHVTGTITATFVNYELYEQLCREMAEETQARREFLERTTGLQFEVKDP